MTRRVRLWITAVLSIAATALMVGLTVAAQAGVDHAHTHPPSRESSSTLLTRPQGVGAAAVRDAHPRLASSQTTAGSLLHHGR